MSTGEHLPIERFLQAMDIVAREGSHLAYSWGRLFSSPIDIAWVRKLEEKPELAERLEAFVSRFGRMQDTITDKLLPRWLTAIAETPGSVIETLNRAERLDVLKNVEQWLEARKLRNRLVHEYMVSPEAFAEDILLAKEYSFLLVDCLNRLREFAATRMEIDEERLPKKLALAIKS